MQQVLTAPAVSFGYFTRVLYRDALVTSLLAMLCVFFVFKTVYVDPDFSEASFVYIDMAGGKNWLPLYIPFLRLIHAVTTSPWVLVAVQYLLLQTATLWLALVVCWLMQPEEKRGYLLLVLLAVNPLALFIANHISVDVLYTTVLFAWLAILLLAVKRNTVFLLLLAGSVWVLLLAVRYQTLWLLPVLLVVVYKRPVTLRVKIALLAAPLLLAAGLLTAVGAFKPLAQWKQYNNALYILEAPTVKPVEMQPVPESGIGKVVYYTTPQLEQFMQYSMGRTSMKFSAWLWFKTKNAWLNCHWYKGSYYLLSPFLLLWWGLQLLAFVLVLRLLGKNSWRRLHVQQQSVILVLTALLLCHLLFSVTAAPMLLRCQLPAIVIALLLAGSVPGRRAVCS